MQNPHYCRIMEGVQFVADEEGYIVSILSADYSRRKRMREFLARGVDGLVLALGAYDIAEFSSPNLPTVGIDQNLNVDYRQAILDMVKKYDSVYGMIESAWTYEPEKAGKTLALTKQGSL